jgi:hypothetical protein
MTRGPDYAAKLTPAQQRTLDELRAYVTGMAADRPAIGPGRPRNDHRAARWWVAGLAAAGVTAIALAAGLLPARSTLTPPPIPLGSTRQPSTEDVLRQLAAAATTEVPVPAAVTQTSLVVLATHKNGPCVESVLQLVTTIPPGHLKLRIEVDQAAVVPSIRTWVDCPIVAASPDADRPLFAADAGPGVDGWTKLQAQMQLKNIFVADLTDPRTMPGGLVVEQLDPAADRLPVLLDKAATTVGPDDTDAAWWTVVGQLLASPMSSPALRSAVLSLAIGHGATVVTDHPTDILGRPGVTLRVPYVLNRTTGQADLTFDTATARLLQRAAQTTASPRPTLTAVTAYR